MFYCFNNVKINVLCQSKNPLDKYSTMTKTVIKHKNRGQSLLHAEKDLLRTLY